MNSIQSFGFLRRVLLVDALCSAGMAIAMLSFTSALAALLELPADLIGEAGLVLIPFAMCVGYLATREQPARWAVRAVIALNVIWAIDSLVLLFTGWVAPNAFGYAFVLTQGIVVGGFAQLEVIGLRKSLPLTA